MHILTGIRPTGRMHIGHYFSVIKPALDFDATVLIAEFHAPKSLPEEVDKMVETLNHFRVPMNHVAFQSEEFDATLYFRLLSIARVGELERMTQYQSAGDDNDAHLLVYPVLMVHDVVGYDQICVGEDQAQHLNYARDLIERYNRIFNQNEKLPEPRIVGGRIMSLSDPTKKMSKSEPDGCLFLDDSPMEIDRKITAAVMDEEGRKNLISLYYDLNGAGPIPLMNSEFKPMVTEKLVSLLHKKTDATHV